MASIVTLVGNAALAGTEQIDSATSPASTSGGNTRRFTAYNVENVSLNASSTPSIDSPPADLSTTLAAASETVDLTAAPLARDITRSYDFSGSRLVAILINADPANSGPVTIEPSPANGYDLFGPAGKVTLQPGEALVKLYQAGANNSSPVVSVTERDIDISGAVGDKVEIIAYFGA